MSIYVNFKDFTVSSEAKADRTCIVSAHQLGELCTPAKLNRFAEKIMGERFQRGTPLKKGAELLFGAMKKAVGDGGENEPSETPTTKKNKPAQGGGKSKPKPKPKTGNDLLKYEKAATAIQEEYNEVVESLSIVGKYIDKTAVLDKAREERLNKLKALGNIKRFL